MVCVCMIAAQMHIQARKYTNIRCFLTCIAFIHSLMYALFPPLNQRNWMQSIYVYGKNHLIQSVKVVICVRVSCCYMELVLYESKMQFMHRRRYCCRCRFHVAVVDKINTIDIFVMWSCIETTNIAGTSQLTSSIQIVKLLSTITWIYWRAFLTGFSTSFSNVDVGTCQYTKNHP